jgi:AraC-like DNA-binding protein
MQKVDEFLHEKQLYRKPSLSLKELSSSYGVNERHLSQAINDVKGKNFFDYVNGFRVEHSKLLLTHNIDGRRTMFDIFWESGFNSKTTFNTTFKKITGLTPTEFQKSVNK